ncbi:hypothetical protein [Paracoccus sp. JM45]|uniref:hypothetical protein n=1 Tax=Paracoccus sp. JM45 TaxID=2283626 RepID=UPI000E6C039C|nr:hypothetical protein [Paracoccus sp. JM45]RJE79111.1 hypothetical protein DWB67_13665 [Paracoccus sp. JM45]
MSIAPAFPVFARPDRHGNGRSRVMPVSRLALHSDAFNALRAYRDIGGLGALNPTGFINVMQDRDGRLLWFSAFALITVSVATGRLADVFIWRAAALPERLIAKLAWSEVCRPERRLKPAEAAEWYKILSTRLPPDIAKAYFGPRGLNRNAEEAADIALTEEVDLGFEDRTADAVTRSFATQPELLELQDRSAAWLADHGNLSATDCATIIRATGRAMTRGGSPAVGAPLCAASLL